MNRRLERDLAAWEEGALPLPALERLHPSEELGGLIGLYERLAALGAEPVAGPALGWERLRSRLTDWAPAPPARLRYRVTRPLVAAAAAIVLTAAVGYAAAPEAINERLVSIWRSIESLFGSDDAGDKPKAPATTVPPGDPSPGAPGVAPAGDGGGDEAVDGEDEEGSHDQGPGGDADDDDDEGDDEGEGGGGDADSDEEDHDSDEDEGDSDDGDSDDRDDDSDEGDDD